jgi:hypothetical protein
MTSVVKLTRLGSASPKVLQKIDLGNMRVNHMLIGTNQVSEVILPYLLSQASA